MCSPPALVELASLDKDLEVLVAINIENTVTVSRSDEFLTLEEIREFVANTETWASETKVRLRTGGQRDPFSQLTSKYGDTTGNY